MSIRELGLTMRYPEWIPYHTDEWTSIRNAELVKRCVAKGLTRIKKGRSGECEGCGRDAKSHRLPPATNIDIFKLATNLGAEHRGTVAAKGGYFGALVAAAQRCVAGYQEPPEFFGVSELRRALEALTRTRRITFRCTHCPTTVTVETELPASVPPAEHVHSDQVYVPEMMVGGNSRDGDYVTANLCPACGCELALVPA